MHRTPIHLHEHEHLKEQDTNKRLNLFPGRAMSEVAFDKSQYYVADRIAPLLSGVWPGIQEGLEVTFLDEKSQANPLKYKGGQLTRMAYDTQGPSYPADESLSGFNHPMREYFKEENKSVLPPEPEIVEPEPLFRIKAGSGVTAAGTVVKLFNPLEVAWTDLIARSNLTPDKSATGLYMLCLGRKEIAVDYDEAPACRRHETDPTRDTRFETVGILKLIPVEGFLHRPIDLFPKNKHTTVNRFLTRLIVGPKRPKLPRDYVTLGLVAMQNQKLKWFETHGARFMSEPLGLPMAMLAHMEQVFSESIAASKHLNPASALNKLVKDTKLNFISLPAAGALPRRLLANVTSIDKPNLPKFLIDYPGLRVDMAPIPASGVAGVLQRELGRGVVSFSPNSEERLRLLIAVPDGEYDPRLLDVPVSDKKLSEQLYQYGMHAYDAWKEWREQLGKLYSQEYDMKNYGDEVVANGYQLTNEERKAMVLPDLAHPYYKPPIAPRNPAGNLDSTDPKVVNNKKFFFDDLVNNRFKAYIANESKVISYKLIPPPYREGVPINDAYSEWVGNDGLAPAVENSMKPGLMIRRAEIEKDIFNTNEDLESANELVEKISDLLLLQRQQLDAQSVSFATFAGGVAGDGSGLQLTRWLPFVSFDANTAAGTEVIDNTEVKADSAPKKAEAKETAPLAYMAKSMAYSFPGINYAALAKASAASVQPKIYAAAAPKKDLKYSATSYEKSLKAISASSYLPTNIFPKVTKKKGTSSAADVISASMVPGIAYANNDAYVNLAVKNTTKSNYEAVSKLSMGVNKLNNISSVSSALSSGAFKTANKDFGVLKHISVIDKDLDNAREGVEEIFTDSNELLGKIKTFISDDLSKAVKSKLKADEKLIELLVNTKFPDSTVIKNGIIKLESDIRKKYKTYATKIGKKESDFEDVIAEELQSKGNALRYGYLFKINRYLVRYIGITEKARGKLIRIQKVLQQYIVERQKDIKDMDEDIVEARRELAQLEAVRREALEDYSAAQRLVIEHWKAVEDKFNHRNNVLNSMLGLYYVKVRETSTSTKLPEIHTLSYAEVGDLVPGCRRDEQVILPDELSVFMDAVLDIPMYHWTPLTSHIQQLPSKQSLLVLLERRNSRVQNKQAQLSRNTFSRIRGLSNLRRQSMYVMQSFAGRRFTSAASLKALQYEASKILSLEDLMNNTAGGRMRKPAYQLANNLELACHCFLEKLNELPPSIRLTWGQLAEDDHLPIDYPEKWPEIERAEDAAFNSLRTALELVRWFNRQLTSNADGDSRTAMRVLVRACLMLAASDDPGDLLEGRLQVAPAILSLGSVLKLTLNQDAVPGATLQLLDANKKAVARLRIDDQDSEGASATIVNLFEKDSQVDTQNFMVVGHKYKQRR